ncbi:hypothetical protein ABZT03_08420 [Streptomyces sp. NPDC005574]|uniref:hypothetical protein n=1 Tax=Streptomyces sp. NPDC005574 TaxID=3156891 RepID=UPI0033A8C227
MSLGARGMLAVTAAALAGSGAAVTAVRWWSRRQGALPARTPALYVVGQDPPDRIAPEDLLRRHWSTLHPLDLAP